MNFYKEYKKVMKLFKEETTDLDMEQNRERRKMKKLNKQKPEDKNMKKGKREEQDTNDKDVVGRKRIDLITGEVEISLIAIDKKDEYRINIKYLDDAKFSGFVTYKGSDDAKNAYKGINTVGELMNFINIHAETDASIFPALKILKKEIIAIKRDLSKEEIADLALEFPV